MRRSDDVWDDLIGDLYAGAFEAEAAARAPAALAALLGGGTAALWRLDPVTARPLSVPMTNAAPEAVALYLDGWHLHDPWTLPLARQRDGRIVRGQEVVDDAVLARSDFYDAFGRRAEMFHVMGSAMPVGPRESLGVAVQRPRGMGAFEAEAVAGLARILPHARRALRLAAQVGAERMPVEAGLAALDALEAGLVLLTGEGRVMHANAAAEALAREGAVLLRQRGEDGRIAASLPGDTAWLRAAVADAARAGPGGSRCLRDARGAGWAATVVPLPRRLALQGTPGVLPGMALLVLRPLAPPAGTERVEATCMALFGLSQAEAAVAGQLVRGIAPEAIAERRGVRLSTVRTLLRRAMEKAGTPNLRDLTRLLASLGA